MLLLVKIIIHSVIQLLKEKFKRKIITMTNTFIFFILFTIQIINVIAFNKYPSRMITNSKTSLKMFELEANTATYAAMFAVTIIPSLVFGDQADSSRGSLSNETKERFKKAMMEQPGANFSIPTTDEEEIKKQIAKAYMQDKDVDVAVLEEKLKKRVQWRKEMMAQSRTKDTKAVVNVDEDGW